MEERCPPCVVNRLGRIKASEIYPIKILVELLFDLLSMLKYCFCLLNPENRLAPRRGIGLLVSIESSPYVRVRLSGRGDHRVSWSGCRRGQQFVERLLAYRHFPENW